MTLFPRKEEESRRVMYLGTLPDILEQAMVNWEGVSFANEESQRTAKNNQDKRLFEKLKSIDKRTNG